MIDELEETAILKEAMPRVEGVLNAVAEICGRYQITALQDFQDSCRTFAEDKILNVAVFGRFKAGKSSFLNHLIGRPLLPVGVIPITSAVTEIQYGATERADVIFQDGRTEAVPLSRIGEFMSETENPENAKGVARVRLELPAMERYRGIRFVDTPGLDSVFEHNTGASLEWLPNVGLALVAVGVDPPLSQHDLELIRSLKRYTPRIALLLTKVDVLDEGERLQVQNFVRSQLARCWDGSVPLFPFSIRPGFEGLHRALDESLLSEVRLGAGHQREVILRHKLDSLLDECAAYLTVALQAAEISDSERAELRQKILGEKESLADSRLALQLIVRHRMGGIRASFESLLKADEAPVRNGLLTSFRSEFPAWTRSLRVVLERFEDWLRASLVREMDELSRKHREEFVEPVEHVSRQLAQSLQDFRNRLSERALETLGVPLRTTEVDFRPEAPRKPDVRVGKIFDRNWELLSLVVPMRLVKTLVKRHFESKIQDAVFMNLSRLVSQWEEVVAASLVTLRKEAERRFDEFVLTIERLIAAAGEEAPHIRADLQRLACLRAQDSEDETGSLDGR
jgi:GTP-binding protein EngB required for normal cell division